MRFILAPVHRSYSTHGYSYNHGYGYGYGYTRSYDDCDD
jgi:hypothetical protein